MQHAALPLDGPKADALKKSLAALTDLERSVSCEAIDEPPVLLDKINKFAETLNQLLESGRNMDESSMFPIPTDMLAFLDGDTSNPELYQHKVYAEVETKAQAYADRLNYLQAVKTECEAGVAVVKRRRENSTALK
jgi:hypothetical protein